MAEVLSVRYGIYDERYALFQINAEGFPRTFLHEHVVRQSDELRRQISADPAHESNSTDLSSFHGASRAVVRTATRFATKLLNILNISHRRLYHSISPIQHCLIAMTHERLILEIIHLSRFRNRRQEFTARSFASLLHLCAKITERFIIASTFLSDIIVDAECLSRSERDDSNRCRFVGGGTE